MTLLTEKTASVQGSRGLIARIYSPSLRLAALLALGGLVLGGCGSVRRTGIDAHTGTSSDTPPTTVPSIVGESSSETVRAGSVTKNAEMDGGRSDSTEAPVFLDRIGFTAGLDAGFSARFNGYSTYEPLLQTQIPVDYDTKVLSVFDLHVETGVLRSDMVEFDYQTSVPRTDFQPEALSYREDRAFGLEKYTFGVDTTPLWLLILPDDASGIVKRILALRFRSIRELSQ